MKLKIKNPRVLIFMVTGAALLIAIITSSIAWFSVSGTMRVGTRAMQLSAKESAALDLEVPDLAAEYERYMGETGTEFDGADSPYLVEYSPVIIDYAEDENLENKYLTYYFDLDTSYIQRVIHSSAPIRFSSEELWDNFVMNLVELTPRLDENDDPVLDENDKPIYDPTGVVYWGENGFFRNTHDGTLLQLSNGKNVFTLNIYFQGDVGYHLLQSTEADIDDKYAFDYSDEIYMFAMFHLSTVFNVVGQHSLRLEGGSTAYDTSFSDLSGLRVVFDAEGASYTSIGFTGFSLQKPDGTFDVYKVPEILDEDNVDYAHYFKDWFDEYTDEESVSSYYLYRATKANGTADNVVTLSLRPLRGEVESLYSCWGDSYVLTLGGCDEVDDDEYVTQYYVRPQGVYYDNAGYLTYAPATHTVSVNNPRGGLLSNVNATGVGTGISHSIPAPTREGYRFVGWSLRDDLPDYACNADLSAVPLVFTSTNSYRYDFGATGNGHDLTLYAVWQEVGVEVTFVVENSWTHNYATVVGGHVTFDGQNTDFVNNTVTIELPKYTDMTQVTATAVATIGETNRNLTLKYWTRYDSINHSYEKVDNAYDLTEATTFYPVWNERAEYTVTLDVNMHSSNLAYVYGTIAVNTPITIDHYTVTFNDAAGDEYASTGNFSDKDRGDIKVKVLEGMTINDLGLSVTAHREGLATGNSVEGWYTNVCSDGNDMLATSWSTANRDAVKYNTTAITSNIKLWVRFN